NIYQYSVNRPYELSYTAFNLINVAKNDGKLFDAVICIGLLLNNLLDEIDNNKVSQTYWIDSITQTVMKVSIKTNTPIIHGIIHDYEGNIKNNNILNNHSNGIKSIDKCNGLLPSLTTLNNNNNFSNIFKTVPNSSNKKVQKSCKLHNNESDNNESYNIETEKKTN
ncbi:hypothetical protein PIROE2DRAFT_11241, partial [Piromyces sp. E2]